MIFSPFERMVAWRYLRARREEGFVSVIAGFSLVGIALGVATLIIVMSVMNGFRADLLGRILGLNGHIGVHAADRGKLRDFDALAEKLRAVPGVVSAMPVVEGQVMAIAGNLASGVVVRAARKEDLKQRPIIAGNIVAGTLDALEGRDTILVGARLAQRYGLSPGSRLRLVSPQPGKAGVSSMPLSRTFRVAAVFQIGMFEYDNGFVYLPLEAGQSYFKTGKDAVTNLEVVIADPAQAQDTEVAISAALGPGFDLVPWQEAQKSFVTALKVERVTMFVILTLMIVIAAFNIIAGLIMLVKEKGRGIAILRTMGARQGSVLRIFLLAGASVGVAGTLAGFALGVGIALNMSAIQGWVRDLAGPIPFITSMPSIVQPMDVASVVTLAFCLSVAATIYPAWRAARLDPVEALRHE